MKVIITHLKCTDWPEGAKVGDVVEVDGDAIPSWATGKCEPAPAAAQAQEEAEKAPEAVGKGKK